MERTPAPTLRAAIEGRVAALKAAIEVNAYPNLTKALEIEVVELIAALAKPDAGEDTSDGYHTFKELYGYRRAYNALLFNEWAAAGKFDVHKSWHHSDGEPCFGGGWFIVTAQTPFGQVSNHEKAEHWNLFQVPKRERAATWDGHTPQVALERLLSTAKTPPPSLQPSLTREEWGDIIQALDYLGETILAAKCRAHAEPETGR